jgi:DNA-binding winged helix-turn-helix (wHTH) protein
MLYVFGDFELDDSLFELRRCGERIALRPQALSTLLLLVRARDRVVTKEELLRDVWSNVTVSYTALPQAITAIRRALGEGGEDQRMVQTIRARGYRFVAPTVKEVQGEERPEREVSELPFTGREAFLRRVRELLESGGGVMLVAGGIGVGKSRAAVEAAAIARSAGALVLTGRAYDDEGVPELWPWLQVVRTAADPALEALLAPRDFSAFDAVTRALVQRATATKQPIVIVLDDMHWADAGSLLLLKILARATRNTRVLVIATYRDVALASSPTLARAMGALTRDDPARCITLEPLSLEASTSLIRAALGRDLPPDALARIHQKAAGSPLYLTQMLHVMRIEARLAPLPNGATSAMLAADTIREAISLHLRELSPSCHRALMVAALLGPTFSLPVLARLLDQDRADVVGKALDEALAIRVVVRMPEEDGTFAFAHGLVRDVLYKKLAIAERAQLHAAAASLYENAGDHAASSVHREKAIALVGPPEDD